MKRVPLMVTAVVMILGACEAGLVPSPTEDTLHTVSDVLRDADFDYATMVPVAVQVEVDLQTNRSRSLASGTLATVRITDAGDRTLFAAAAADGETASGEILIPSDSGSLTLEIVAAGHEPFSVAVDNPSRFAELNRVVGLVESASGVAHPDTDGDGVIDPYDAEPTNDQVAFVRNIPAGGALTVAFEDNYPELGDGDYNDFVATYSLSEYRSSRNNLVKVRGTATALARGAGFEHEFGIVLRFAGLNAMATVVYDSRAGLENLELIGSNEIVLPLFPATSESFERPGSDSTMDNVTSSADLSDGYVTTFTVIYTATGAEPPADVWKPYDPYLRVFHTGKPNVDIHLIGQPPLPDSENHLLDPAPAPGFRDPDHYPWALLVPGGWQWPLEHSASEAPIIEHAYADFSLWVGSQGTTHTDWYNRPVSGQVYLSE